MTECSTAVFLVFFVSYFLGYAVACILIEADA